MDSYQSQTGPVDERGLTGGSGSEARLELGDPGSVAYSCDPRATQGVVSSGKRISAWSVLAVVAMLVRLIGAPVLKVIGPAIQPDLYRGFILAPIVVVLFLLYLGSSVFALLFSFVALFREKRYPKVSAALFFGSLVLLILTLCGAWLPY